ncbi:type II toxin-antitoxin system RelE/ParE family toxin [Lactovum odontotermitis]
MTYKLEFTKMARQEFDEIYRFYLETYSDKQPAVEVAQGIQAAIASVLPEPEEALSFDARIGFSTDKNHELYFTISEQYLIFFVVIDKTVVIVHFLRTRAVDMNHLKLLFENFSERTLKVR